MKKKRVLIGLATIVLSSLMLASCDGKDKTTANNTKDLKIWSSRLQPASTLSSWKDSPFHTGLEKATGISATWEFPTEGTDASQAFSLMISEAQLPDIIQYPLGSSAEMYIEDGIVKDLTKLLPKKAPNYWKFLQEHPDYDRAVKTDSGKYYMFAFLRENITGATVIGPMVRKDWLDEQGLATPTNIQEWENVIRTFNKAYGAKLAFKTSMSPGFAGGFGAYGAFGLDFYINKKGKVELAQAQPEWQDYVKWIHKLYVEGLIDPDTITLDDSGLKTKVQNNKVGVTITTAGTLTSYMEDAKAANSSANWVGITYPNQVNGKKAASIYYNQIVNGTGFQIGGTTKNDKLEKALEWLDWSYSEEGTRFWNFGVEGKSYEMKDGKPVFTEEITKSNLGTIEALKKYTGNVDSGIGVQKQEVVNARMTPAALQAEADWYNKNDMAIATAYPLLVSYTAAESKELASITNTLNTFVLENCSKFMTGERSTNEIDTFIQELKDQGLDRLIEIKQAAYNRYEAR